jgi:divalent metal cation (Fe/Co/Zn/Cd) transporter
VAALFGVCHSSKPFADAGGLRSRVNGDVATASAVSREEYVRRGRQLEYFTIGYNSLEGVTSIVAGLIAGSASLVGFGLDSLIEVTSGTTLLWRLRHDLDISRREQVERIALRMVGCFVALALYILYESSAMLIGRVPPQSSIAGIVIAAISVIVMPLLARAKRRVARQLGSEAMHADSKQADFCSYLSVILFGGRLLNALFGWWWMDPAAGLVMVPIIAKEGISGLRAEVCCDRCGFQ